MQRIIVALLVAIMAMGLMAAGAAASEHALGDLGKPADYDKTIKRFRDIIPDLDAYVEQTLPASYDWRTYGMVTVAKDQGNCGGCWSFASAGALESKILMMGRPRYDISEQQQISCNTDMLGCSGGMADALKFWYNTEPMLESCTGYPSSGGSVPACGTLASCSKLPYHTTGYYTVNTANVSEIKTSLYTDGPTYFRFDCYSDFYLDAGNFWDTASPGAVYTQTSGTNQGGHAVLIIGWDDSKQAWLLKNSWGATTGPNHDGTWWMAYTQPVHNLNFGMANVDITYASPDVLHKDGAIYRATGWTLTTPPYYPGTSYAVSMKTKSDGSTAILHKDGAIWNSSTGWNTATPPYYPGTGYAKDLEFKPATTLIDEHFEGTFKPAGWTVVDNLGGGGIWQLNTSWGRSNSTGGTGNCADADSDAWGGTMDTELWTPFFSLAGLTSATLSFKTDFYVYSGGGAEYADVDISINGGPNWTNLAHWTTNHRAQAVTLDLTPYCGYSYVLIRFHYGSANYDWWFEVDDVKVVGGVSSTTILHKDGALWNSAAGWTLATPPNYPGSDYARDLEYRSNGSYLILHKYGAIYDSAAGWTLTTPPYYPGNDYARALQLKAGETNYVILHKDGALWSTDGGWVLTCPPYYPGSDYARGLEQVGSKYIILHKDGAIYDSIDGWYLGTPPYYPGTGYAVGLEAR